MAASVSSKEIFQKARDLEKHGKKRQASAQYAVLGVFLRKRGRFKEAKVFIDRAIFLTPDSTRLFLQRAVVETALGNNLSSREAMAVFTRRALRSEKREKYQTYLEAQLTEYPALRQIYYEKRLETDRTTAAPFLALANAERQLGRSDRARKTLIDALKTRTMPRETLDSLRQLLEEQQEPDAVSHLKRFESGDLGLSDFILLLSGAKAPAPVAKPPAAAPRAPEAPAVPIPQPVTRPEERGLQELIKELEEEIGLDVEQHRDSVDPLVREFRRKSDKILGNDSKARIDMALAFFEMGLNEDARDELKPVESTDRHYLEAQCLLGEILLSEGSQLGALEIFQNCLRDDRARDEITFEARYKLVQIYFRLGDLTRALDSALELEKRAPGYRDLRRIKAQIQEALGPVAVVPAEEKAASAAAETVAAPTIQPTTRRTPE